MPCENYKLKQSGSQSVDKRKGLSSQKRRQFSSKKILTFLNLRRLLSLSKYLSTSSSSNEVYLRSRRAKLSSGMVGMPLEYSVKWVSIKEFSCHLRLCSITSSMKAQVIWIFQLSTKQDLFHNQDLVLGLVNQVVMETKALRHTMPGETFLSVHLYNINFDFKMISTLLN